MVNDRPKTSVDMQEKLEMEKGRRGNRGGERTRGEDCIQFRRPILN